MHLYLVFAFWSCRVVTLMFVLERNWSYTSVSYEQPDFVLIGYVSDYVESRFLHWYHSLIINVC